MSHGPLATSSAMHSQYGGMLRTIFDFLFKTIPYPSEPIAKITALAEQGVVVYVARSKATWLALYFNYIFHSSKLPLAKFVAGIRLWLWQPVFHLFTVWTRPMVPPEKAWLQRYGTDVPSKHEIILANVVLQGHPAAIFLNEPVWPRRLSRPSATDFLRSLVAAQRLSSRPFYLIPHAVISVFQGGMIRQPASNRLFGLGRRKLRPLPLLPIMQSSRGAIRVADVVDLQNFVREHASEDDPLLARRLRHEIERRISSEECVVAGPPIPEFQALKRRILREQRLRAVLEQECINHGTEPHAEEKRVVRYLREIAARYNPLVVLPKPNIT